MRWERLFDDLEAQADAAAARELADEVDERSRIEQGRLPLLDRLRAASGTAVTLGCAGERVSGRVQRVAADAVVLDDGAGDVLVAAGALDWVLGLGRGAIPPEAGRVAAGLGMRSLLRAVARDRNPVRLRLRDGSSPSGTIDTVGQDWFELAEHPAGEPRRSAAVTQVRVVALGAVVTVRLG